MRISKKERVLRHMQMGLTITQLQAWQQYSTFTLAQIIQKLREEGYDIETKMNINENTKANYARYRLKEKLHQAKLF